MRYCIYVIIYLFLNNGNSYFKKKRSKEEEEISYLFVTECENNIYEYCRLNAKFK